MKCPRPSCGYEWIPRRENPKACPMCKQYFPREIIGVSEAVSAGAKSIDLPIEDADISDERVIVPFDDI